MPDLLTGPQEREVEEVIDAYREALDAIDLTDPTKKDAIARLEFLIKVNTETLDWEIPSPRLCVCNRPKQFTCQFGHLIDPATGYSFVEEYLPAGVK